MYKLTTAQTDKARIFPWGINGNVIKVGEWTVTDIEVADSGVLIITANSKKTGKPARYVIREWVHGEIAEQSTEVIPSAAKKK
jgi:hypothetical protein